MDFKKTLIKIEQELVWRAISLSDEVYLARLYDKGSLYELWLELRLAWVELRIESIVNFRQMFYGE
jgi:hypothetical protein